MPDEGSASASPSAAESESTSIGASNSAAGIAPIAAAAPRRAAGLGSSRSVAASFATRRFAPAAFDFRASVSSPPFAVMYSSANAPSARTAASRMSAVGWRRFSSRDARSLDRMDFGPVFGADWPTSSGCAASARHSTYRHVAARITSPPFPRYSRAFSISSTSETTRSPSSPSSAASPARLSARSASAAPSVAPCLFSSAGERERSSSPGNATRRVHAGSRAPSVASADAASSRVARSQCCSLTSTRWASNAGRYASKPHTKSSTAWYAFRRDPSAK